MSFQVKVIYKQPHPITGDLGMTHEGATDANVKDGILFILQPAANPIPGEDNEDVFAYNMDTIHSFTQI